MSNKFYFIAGLIILVTGYVAGRYSAPEKITDEKKAETKVEAIQTQKTDTEKSGEKVQIITQIIRPDGARYTRTRIETRHESSAKAVTESQTKTDIKTDEKKVTVNSSGVTAGFLVGMSTKSFGQPIYGSFLGIPAIWNFNVLVLGQVGTPIGVAGSLGLSVLF